MIMIKHFSNHCDKVSKRYRNSSASGTVTRLLTLSGRKEEGESADDDLGFHASFLPVLKLLVILVVAQEYLGCGNFAKDVAQVIQLL